MRHNYRSQALGTQDGVHLVVALYDGLIKFLRQAEDAQRAGDGRGAAESVRRAVKIVSHLQSRLLPQTPVTDSISEFHASVLALMLEALRLSSADKLRDAQGCVFNVRDAWKQVAAAS